MKAKNEYIFKVAVIGDHNVGKTCLTARFTRQEFISDVRATIGVDFSSRVLEISPKADVRLQLWDTAGQEKFRAVSGVVYRGAAAAVIVYDISSQSSFDSVIPWIKQLRDYAPDCKLCMLVGNKVDLAREGGRVVSAETAEMLAKQEDCLFKETSALDGRNVQDTFVQIATELHRRHAVPEENQQINSEDNGRERRQSADIQRPRREHQPVDIHNDAAQGRRAPENKPRAPPGEKVALSVLTFALHLRFFDRPFVPFFNHTPVPAAHIIQRVSFRRHLDCILSC